VVASVLSSTIDQLDLKFPKLTDEQNTRLEEARRQLESEDPA
jgi:hypothetical protein